MKSIQYQLKSYGKPGVYQKVECETKPPGEMEVSVEVAYCGLNRLDLWLEAGELPVQIELPRIPGGEVSGVIAEAGPGVEEFKAGDKIIVQSNLVCGECEFCKRGEESNCLKSKLLGVDVDGGLSTYMTVPVSAVLPIPDGIPLDAAASIVLAGSTAMHMLTNRTQVSEGDWVLVMGGNSGVGSYAIQIAKSQGAHVIATASDNAKSELSKKLGADFVVNHRDKDWHKEVRRITQKRGVDIIVEHIGGEILEKCFMCLARGGRIVTCGATAGKDISLNIWPFFVKQQQLIGSYGRNREDLLMTLKWLSQGKIKPVIDTVIPFDDVPLAFSKLRNREVSGKILVELKETSG